MAIESVGDNEDIDWVGYSGDESCGNHDFLPGEVEVDVEDAIVGSVPDVLSHGLCAVGGANMYFADDHVFEILVACFAV